MRNSLVGWVVVGVCATAWAGPTAHVGKELTKGVTDQVKEEAKGVDLQKGAKDVAKGLVDGMAGHGKALEHGANGIGRELVQGMVSELREQSMCKGDNREECLDALVQRYAYASSRAAARGAADGAPGWTSLVTGGMGFVAGLLCAAVIALLLGQRRTRRDLAALRPRTT